MASARNTKGSSASRRRCATSSHSIDKAARGDVNVCIHGESGTGKELIARAIHYASPRRDRPLITLDCTTIPEGLMEEPPLRSM
jgi:transcriptional regulator with GAF, ATPase, and Fis domain